jgi:hypothetical protein
MYLRHDFVESCFHSLFNAAEPEMIGASGCLAIFDGDDYPVPGGDVGELGSVRPRRPQWFECNVRAVR